MPKLTDKVRRTKTIDSVIEGGKIEIYTSFRMKDIEELQAAGDSKTTMTIVKAIASWNFEDENGATLPINEETVGMLDAEDIFKINKVIEEDSFFGKLAAETNVQR